jgi:aminoacrylate hydrolase
MRRIKMGNLMPKAKLRDCEIYYEEHGRGTPLLLVAGLGGTGNYWEPQLPEFSKHFKVIVHDHRGTGQSTRSDIAYSVEQMTADLLGLMDHLRIQRAHLLGHSTGGAIGQRLAIFHSQRLLSLVIYASWTKCDPFMRRIMETRKTLLQAAGAIAYIRATPIFLFPDWWINENAAALQSAEDRLLPDFPPVSIAASRCDAVINFDCESRLHEIRTPTLVFCAEDDFLTPSYFSRSLEQAIPSAELRTIERGGHACSQTVPNKFNDAVLPFLLRNENAFPKNANPVERSD